MQWLNAEAAERAEDQTDYELAHAKTRRRKAGKAASLGSFALALSAQDDLRCAGEQRYKYSQPTNEFLDLGLAVFQM